MAAVLVSKAAFVWEDGGPNTRLGVFRSWWTCASLRKPDTAELLVRAGELSLSAEAIWFQDLRRYDDG